MSQPPWMPHAWADLGTSELPGTAHEAKIVGYARRLGQTWVRDDETPWCAAFVGACLEQAGVVSTRSLAARSYLGWGVAASGPVAGCIVVLSRGADPAAGHVGFLVGWTSARVYLLGGNQSNAVTVAAFDRARVLAFRIPSAATGDRLQPGSGPHAPTAPDLFAQALALVLELEGGWSDDPFDPGGPTNKGITLATFAREVGAEVTAASHGRLKSELRRIPDDLVARIYRDRYWQPSRAPDLPAPLALFHFDTAVNMGVGTFARLLQQALAVEADGEIGPLTLAAARRAEPLAALARYADLRRRRYRSLATFWRFGRGWLARLDAVLARAMALARQTAAGSVPEQSTPAPTTNPGEAPVSDLDARPSPPAPASQPQQPGSARPEPKWWGESLTIWGALLTALSTVAPAVLAAFGFDLPADLAQRLGRDLVAVAQAVGGLAGTVMTIAGRARAAAPIERRAMTVRL